MERYCKLQNYEEERLRLDQIFGYPSPHADTCLLPAHDALFYEGWYYLCAKEPIGEQINAVDITKEEYDNVVLIVRPEEKSVDNQFINFIPS